jgi:two-component system, cell cycle sensor histidine kinase DivJ
MMPIDVARRREYADIIRSSGQHLLSVVNSILDISKIEAGSFQITPDHFELEPLIAQCCDMVRLKAEENGVQLHREPSVNIPEIVADKRAVKQILINLVSNAVKFSNTGGRVTLRSRVNGNAVTIEIEDGGIGVMARDLARLGDPFFQAKDSYDRPYEGTGLGLSVVRGLVGLHGGSMKVESAPGEGTRVTITLPLDCRTQPEQARSRGARIETIPVGPFRVVTLNDKVKQIA